MLLFPAVSRARLLLTLAAVGIFATLLDGPAAAAESTCFEFNPPNAPHDLYAAAPDALGSAWLRELERLEAAIPSLSPWQERSLQEGRATESLEWDVQYAKLDAGALVDILRRALQVFEQPEQAKAWIWFVHTLLDLDGSASVALAVPRD